LRQKVSDERNITIEKIEYDEVTGISVDHDKYNEKKDLGPLKIKTSRGPEDNLETKVIICELQDRPYEVKDDVLAAIRGYDSNA